MKAIVITVLISLSYCAISFAVGVGFGIKLESSKIMTDSLTTHCGKWTIDLPYGLDSSSEGNLLGRIVGDTLYIYHKPKNN